MDKEIEEKMMQSNDPHDFAVKIIQYQYFPEDWSSELKSFHDELRKRPRLPYPGDVFSREVIERGQQRIRERQQQRKDNKEIVK